MKVSKPNPAAPKTEPTPEIKQPTAFGLLWFGVPIVVLVLLTLFSAH